MNIFNNTYFISLVLISSTLFFGWNSYFYNRNDISITLYVSGLLLGCILSIIFKINKIIGAIFLFSVIWFIFYTLSNPLVLIFFMTFFFGCVMSMLACLDPQKKILFIRAEYFILLNILFSLLTNLDRNMYKYGPFVFIRLLIRMCLENTIIYSSYKALVLLSLSINDRNRAIKITDAHLINQLNDNISTQLST